jgi:hypothetical protein
MARGVARDDQYEMTTRRAATLTVVAVACSVVVASASAAVRVVHRGQRVTLSQAFGPATTMSCVVEVTYADTSYWDGPVKAVSGGKVSWTFRIPRKATLGPATWSIRCGPFWHRDGRWRIARAL